MHSNSVTDIGELIVITDAQSQLQKRGLLRSSYSTYDNLKYSLSSAAAKPYRTISDPCQQGAGKKTFRGREQPWEH